MITFSVILGILILAEAYRSAPWLIDRGLYAFKATKDRSGVEFLAIELESATAYYLNGYDSQRASPVIHFTGNACPVKASLWIAREFTTTLDGDGDSEEGVASIYTIDYRCKKNASEEILTKAALELYQEVCQRHKKKPIVISSSIGTAVSLALVEQLDEANLPKCLVLMDPFTSSKEVIQRLSGTVLGKLASWRGKGWFRDNSWESYRRICSPKLKNLPIAVFSATHDDVVPCEMHRKIFAGAVGRDEPVPDRVTARFGVVAKTNDVGTGRLLVQQADMHCAFMHYKIYNRCTALCKQHFEPGDHAYSSIVAKLPRILLAGIKSPFVSIWHKIRRFCDRDWMPEDYIEAVWLHKEAPGDAEKVVDFFKKYILDVPPLEPTEEIPEPRPNPYLIAMSAFLLASLPMLVVCLWLRCNMEGDESRISAYEEEEV